MRKAKEIAKGSTLVATLNDDNFPFGQDKDLSDDLYRIVEQAQCEAIEEFAKSVKQDVIEFELNTDQVFYYNNNCVDKLRDKLLKQI